MGYQTARTWAARYVVLIGMIVVCLCIGILRPPFLRPENLLTVLRAATSTSVMAIGLTFVIGGGGFDLSIAGVSTLAAVLLIWLIASGVPVVVAIVASLAMGAVVGIVCGFLTAKRSLNPFAVTLALWLAANGPQYILLKGGAGIYLKSADAPLLKAIGTGKIAEIPWLVIILLFLTIVCHFILSRTRFGVHLSSIGDNREAALTSGVKVTRLLWMAYVISCLFAALGGVLLAARLHSAQARMTEGYLNDVIAAVYLGVAISPRRRPHVVGTVVGSYFISLLGNGIFMMNVPYWGEYIFRAVMLFVAVMSSGMFQGLLMRRRSTALQTEPPGT
jgi:ribose/xylose/arabinose/galactoside ABC-type transport system permease subunit